MRGGVQIALPVSAIRGGTLRTEHHSLPAAVTEHHKLAQGFQGPGGLQPVVKVSAVWLLLKAQTQNLFCVSLPGSGGFWQSFMTLSL